MTYLMFLIGVTVERQELKEVGLKITNPRIKVLAVLEQTQYRHMSAEDVHKALLEQKLHSAMIEIKARLSQRKAVQQVEDK